MMNNGIHFKLPMCQISLQKPILIWVFEVKKLNITFLYRGGIALQSVAFEGKLGRDSMSKN